MVRAVGVFVVAWAAVAVWLAAAVSAVAEEGNAAVVEIGAEIGRLSFIDTRYLPRNLGEFGDRSSHVLAFVTNGCPLSLRYLPRLSALEKEYRARGVQFLLVNVGVADTVVEAAAVAIEHGVAFPVAKDLEGAVARAVGARRTPEVAVLDGGFRLRYRGRVDAQYRLGGVRPDPGREDLRQAIEDVLAGRDVQVPETEVDGCLIPALTPAPPERIPGFAEEVAPILQVRCQECHRPGGEAPFPLLSYEDARKRAETIAEAIRLGRMPPWFADPRHGQFVNDRRLTDDERRTVLDWVRGGAPSGDLAKMPPPREWPQTRWSIGRPDLVLRAADEAVIPAEGYVPYRYDTLHRDTRLPFIFPEDTWIQGFQILSRNPRVLHHANAFYFDPAKGREEVHFITGQVPGGQALAVDPGFGFLIPKGSALVLQVHYVTTGKEETDLLRVGIVFAKHPIRKRLRHYEIHNNRFAIPPGAPAHRVEAKQTVETDITAVGAFAHMHLRGRDMTFRARYPDGRDETLLSIPNYSFDWQLAYVWERDRMRFPRGTVLEVFAHFDNTDFNPYNPDSKETVRFGQQTIHEMMYGFFFYTEDGESLDLHVDPRTGRAVSAADAAEPAPGARESAGR